MVQSAWGQHSTLRDPEVVTDVCETWLRDNHRMAFGVDARFVDPRVQGRVVNVVDLLVGGHAMIQLDGIGASSAKGVTRVERFHELQGFHIRLDVWLGFLELGPMSFPYFENSAPFPAKGGDFGLGLFVDVSHATVTETQVLFIAYGITLGTTVLETPLKFVHSAGLVMETVHSERGPGGRDTRQHCLRAADDDGGQDEDGWDRREPSCLRLPGLQG